MRSRDWLAKVSATAGGQYSFAVILACMDSRAPIEIIFDQRAIAGQGKLNPHGKDN